ncbi:SusC/RagA family TonB-linked outer membrane protein [Pedobacter gandavensis]|uniref:SusC/RagA family TonB-linked outer membrane protein n=1 Tax=Pedobacter gandavensis TaxID=2679963 RepID=UPI0029317E67|nr:SusC/RagA family TonB-linked outer membrane protein [Pedobacter gandavensis]
MYKIYPEKGSVYRLVLHKLILSMRLTTIILISTFMQVSAATFGQRVTLNEQKSSIESVLKKIRSQTGYDFLFDRKIVQHAPAVDLKLNNVTLDEALKAIFNKGQLGYNIAGKIVVIELKQKSILDKVLDLFTEIDIKGRVVDENGRPLKGATVSVVIQESSENKKTGDFSMMVKGRKTAAVTDEKGEFFLKNIDEKALISVSYTGYKSATREAAKELFIKMAMDVSDLDQVQVIAYGAVSKRLNTATVSTVSAATLAQQPVNNVLNSLNGRMTGVQVISGGGGLPGSGISIKVRGDNSFGPLGSSSSDPLYVIDGIPQASGTRFDSQNFNSNISGMNGYTNMFNSLNKEDIEQIDVLKDADATSIYGARGANGVVLITTKKGKSGDLKINLDLAAGAGKVGRFIPMLNTQEYLRMRREAFSNEGITPDADNAPDLTNWDQNADTDFQRLLLGGTALQQTANLNASGGNDFVNYYVGLNYRKEGTVIAKDQHVNRLGGLLNLGFSSADRKFKAQISTNYAIENSSLLKDQSFMELIYLPPNFSLYNADGSLNWDNNFDNPMARLFSKYKAKGTFLSANTNLSYKPLPGLTLRATIGYTLNGLENSFQIPRRSFNPANPSSSYAWFADAPNSNYTIEPQAEYQFVAGPGKLIALVGTTFSEAVSKFTKLKGDNYSYDSQLNNIGAAGVVTTEFDDQQYHFASLFARLSYDLYNKYLLSLTYRNDASSRFGTNNRLANFGSMGAAWIFSEEKWIRDAVPFLSFGKLKMSYGTTGNDRINNYAYLLNYGPGFYPYQDTRPLTPGLPANPDLRWESTKKLELSLNLGFLRDRILFTGNLYRNRSSNMLNYTALPSQTGGTALITNLDAVVQNKGLELELNTKNINSGVFSWSSSFNISFERNVLLSFKDQDKASLSTYFKVGETVDALLTRSKFKFTGIDPISGAPTYADLDGQEGLSPDDMYIASLGHPFYGGLNNSFSYKDFTLDVFFKFEQKMGNVNLSPNGNVPGMMMNQDASVLDRWQKEGDQNKKWPLAVTGFGEKSGSYAYLSSSDFTWGNTSYIKLKSVNLSYNLPKRWVLRAKFHQVKLNVQALNLFSLTKYKYVLDPEYGQSAYPGLRTLMFGINCTL